MTRFTGTVQHSKVNYQDSQEANTFLGPWQSTNARKGAQGKTGKDLEFSEEKYSRAEGAEEEEKESQWCSDGLALALARPGLKSKALVLLIFVSRALKWFVHLGTSDFSSMSTSIDPRQSYLYISSTYTGQVIQANLFALLSFGKLSVTLIFSQQSLKQTSIVSNTCSITQYSQVRSMKQAFLTKQKMFLKDLVTDQMEKFRISFLCSAVF